MTFSAKLIGDSIIFGINFPSCMLDTSNILSYCSKDSFATQLGIAHELKIDSMFAVW